MKDGRDMVGPFARASEEVRRGAGRLGALLGTRNSPWVGAYREAFVRETLASRLPEGLGAASGFVLSPGGERSRQMDVVVYETRSPAPPFAEGGLVVAEAERVRAVVEVKSRIARGSFLQALGALSRVKGWSPPGVPIYAALVAFASSGPEALMRAAQDYYAGRLEGACGSKWRVVDLVAVLGAWSLVSGWLPWPASLKEGVDLEIPALASLETAPEGRDASLHLLVAGLLAHLEGSGGLPLDKPLASSWRPLSHPFGQPAVAVLGELEGVEPGFLARHDDVFRHKGLKLDLERRLILKSA